MGKRPRRDPRLERLKHKVPAWYVPLHLGVTIGLFGGGSVALFTFLPPGPLPLIAWIAAATVIFVANFVEYALHRWPMHKRRRLTQSFFRHHTIEHHRYFTHETMEIGNLREVSFVIPSVPVLFASTTLVVLVMGVLTMVMGLQVGLFASGVLGVYGTLAQLLHLAFHLPDRWMKLPVLRSKVFQAMRRHHTIHHDLRLMTRWNFNIGFPICDALFGTLIWERK